MAMRRKSQPDSSAVPATELTSQDERWKWRAAKAAAKVNYQKRQRSSWYATNLLQFVRSKSNDRFKILTEHERALYGWERQDLAHEAHQRMLEWIDECKPATEKDWTVIKAAAEKEEEEKPATEKDWAAIKTEAVKEKLKTWDEDGQIKIVLEAIINEAKRQARQVSIDWWLMPRRDPRGDDETFKGIADHLAIKFCRPTAAPLHWDDEQKEVISDAFARIRRVVPADLLEAVSECPEVIGDSPDSGYFTADEMVEIANRRLRAKKKGGRITRESLLAVADALKVADNKHNVAVRDNFRQLLRDEETGHPPARLCLSRRPMVGDCGGVDNLFLVEPPDPTLAEAEVTGTVAVGGRSDDN